MSADLDVCLLFFIFPPFIPALYMCDRQADLIDISKATDIHGTKFDQTIAAAPGGVLNKSIVPATYVPFVNYLNSTQLARFGLHNSAYTPPLHFSCAWVLLAYIHLYFNPSMRRGQMTPRIAR